MVTSDFHLFLSLSNLCHRKKFNSLETLQNTADLFCASKQFEFYPSKIDNLVNRWLHAIDNDGEYIEYLNVLSSK